MESFERWAGLSWKQKTFVAECFPTRNYKHPCLFKLAADWGERRGKDLPGIIRCTSTSMSLSLDFNLIMSLEKLCIYPQNTSLSLYRLYRTLIADSNHLINPEAQMDIYCAAAYNSNYFSINFFSWNKDVDLGSGYTRTSVKIVVST